MHMKISFWFLVTIVLLFIFSRIYIHRNSYGIVVLGLRNLYFIFVLHSIIVTLYSGVVCSILPLWSDTWHDRQFIYSNKTSCQILGMILTFTFTFLNFLVALFGYFKIQFYKTFYNNRQQRSLFRFIEIILVCWFFIQMPGRLIVFDSDLRDEQCFYKVNAIAAFFIVLMYAFFIVVHIVIFYLTWKLRNVENEDFPRLRIQIKLNLFVVPVMFISSIILHGFAQIWIHSGGKNPVQYLLLSSVSDQIINSMIMYVTIYVDDTWAIASFLDLGFVDFLSPQESSLPSFPYEKKIKEEKFWIQVPGGHPIQAGWEEVDQHDIWSNVISDSSRINQSKKYANRGCIFECFCMRFTEPLNDESDAIQISSRQPNSIHRHLHE